MPSDAVATFGTILSDDMSGRDAVHVACVVTIAQETLLRAMDVTADGRRATFSAGVPTNGVGIVDPYLRQAVMPGEKFWLFLYPRSITGLRHVWTHPAFPDDDRERPTTTQEQREISEQWLRDFCGGSSGAPDYYTTLRVAEEYLDGTNEYGEDQYLYVGGEDAHGEIPPEFWTHACTVLGRTLPVDRDRPSYFSCSC